MKKILRKIGQLIPWVVAVGILYWLFQLYPPGQILAALTFANVWGFAAFALAYFFAIWLIDTYGVAAILTRFTKPVNGQSILDIRAATYPVSLINYGAGQAAFAYYLQRSLRIPTGDIIGLFTLITFTDLFWVVTLAFIGSFIGDHTILGVDITPTVRIVGYVTYAGVATHLVFWLMHWENRVTGNFWQRIFGWLREKSLFRIFHEASIMDYVRLGLWRFPIHCLLVLSMYLAIQLFNASVPLIAAIGNVPIAVLIGVIPISWSGVGTSNKALIDLLSPHLTALSVEQGATTPAELILAVSLIWMFSNYLCKLLIGLGYLPKVQRNVRRKKKAINSDQKYV